MTIAQAVRDRIAPLVPAGYSVDDLRIGSSRARVIPVAAGDHEAQLLLAQVKKIAGPPLVNELGHPTVMRVVSWVGHAGVPNRNRDYFVPAELEKIAPALFAAPNLGVMDFNHSAVRMFADDPKMIGVWYKAEWAFDQKANNGKGAWGVLATGIMFSWLFPEVADKVLAAQSRNDGELQVSWTWIPGSVETATDENGAYAINHNPVFFTVALLDVPPADPSATGVGTEDPTKTDHELQLLATAERLAEVATAAKAAATARNFDIRSLWQTFAQAARGDEMTIEEMKAKIAEFEAETKRQLEAVKATYAQTVKELEGKLATAEAAVTEHAALVKAHDELTIKVTELTTSREALSTELAKVTEQLTALTAELETAKAALAQVEAEKAEEEAARKEQELDTRLAARIAQLPEAYRTAHERRSDEARTRVEGKWRKMGDEEWTQYVTEEIGLVPMKVGFVARSAALGNLPAAPDDNNDLSDRARRLLK